MGHEIDVASVSIHPKYNNKKLYHDVALLHTETDFELKPHVNTRHLLTSISYYPMKIRTTIFNLNVLSQAGDRELNLTPNSEAMTNWPNPS